MAGTDCRPLLLRRRASRPQLKRDPLGAHTSFMADPSTRGTAWDSYRRRRNSFLAAGLALLVLGGLMILLPNTRTSGYSRVAFVLLVVWIWISDYLLFNWPCPRCGRPLFKGRWFTNLTVDSCHHCGLAKWTSASSQARGA